MALGDFAVEDDTLVLLLVTWVGLAVVAKLRTARERRRGALWRARRSACMDEGKW